MTDRDRAAEDRVSAFYNGVGWSTDRGVTEDAKRFEDLRDAARDYVSRCRQRVGKHIPDGGERLLDMASGPIQYEEYLDFSATYDQRYCVDMSAQALEAARAKIGDHGVFLRGNWLDLDLEENFFDCAISLHTIYHIDKDQQERAVRKLLHVTKPGRPVIIVYSNPRPLFSYARSVLNRLHVLPRRAATVGTKLYVHCHPISWWDRFRDVADVAVTPWRSFTSADQKLLVPDNRLGKLALDALFRLEDAFPRFFASRFQYPMVILTKR